MNFASIQQAGSKPIAQPILTPRLGTTFSLPKRNIQTDTLHFGSDVRAVTPQAARTHVKVASAVLSTGGLADLGFIAHTLQEWIAENQLTNDGRFHLAFGLTFLGALLYAGDKIFVSDGNKALRDEDASHRLVRVRESFWKRATPKAIPTPKNIDELVEKLNERMKPLRLKAEIQEQDGKKVLILTRLPAESKMKMLPQALQSFRNILLQRQLERTLCEILDEEGIKLACDLGHHHIAGGHQHKQK